MGCCISGARVVLVCGAREGTDAENLLQLTVWLRGIVLAARVTQGKMQGAISRVFTKFSLSGSPRPVFLNIKTFSTANTKILCYMMCHASCKMKV